MRANLAFASVFALAAIALIAHAAGVLDDFRLICGTPIEAGLQAEIQCVAFSRRTNREIIWTSKGDVTVRAISRCPHLSLATVRLPAGGTVEIAARQGVFASRHVRRATPSERSLSEAVALFPAGTRRCGTRSAALVVPSGQAASHVGEPGWQITSLSDHDIAVCPCAAP